METAGASRNKFRQSRPYRLGLWLACLLLALPLLAYTLNGAQMRLSGDDYCYNGALSQYGFWGMQVESYTRLNYYNGNRYTLTLVSGLVGLLGPQANGWLPGLALAAWVASLAFAADQAGKAAGFPLQRVEALFLAAHAAALSLAQTPSLEQSLYWRSAMLPYLAPLVTLSLLVGLAAWHSRRERTGAAGLAAITLLAVLSGGFSEVGAALQLSVCGLAIGLLGWAAFRRRGSLRLAGALQAAAAALAGSLIAALLLSLSPHVSLASQTLPERAGLLTLARMTVHNAAVFLYVGLKTHWLAWLASLLAGAGLGWEWHQSHPGAAAGWRHGVGTASAIGLGGAILVLACFAPNAYVQQAAPEGRALILPQFIGVLTLLGLGIAGGWLMGQAAQAVKIAGARLAWAAAAVFLVAGLYPLLPAQGEFAQAERYQRWSRFWDARDAAIRSARAEGVRSLEVVQLDHIIPNVAELSPDPDFWYNNCAEWYYGIDSLAANQPGWDK